MQVKAHESFCNNHFIFKPVIEMMLTLRKLILLFVRFWRLCYICIVKKLIYMIQLMSLIKLFTLFFVTILIYVIVCY
jgi:hypothetical protein